MAKELNYIGRYTDKMSLEEKKDFINLFNKVFDLDYDLEWFRWKYEDNIYGPSYLVLAYQEDSLIGIRSFWRNDLGGKLAYQPCDTAVAQAARGRGVFSQMSKIALEEVGQVFIYNFPNENSLPGNLKLGWEIDKYAYLELVGNRGNLQEKTTYIKDDYLIWRFKTSPLREYFSYQKGGHSYLLYRRKGNFYYVLGRFSDKYRDAFSRVRFPILLNYTDKEGLIYRIFKNRATIVSLNKTGEQINIPIFKADYI